MPVVHGSLEEEGAPSSLRNFPAATFVREKLRPDPKVPKRAEWKNYNLESGSLAWPNQKKKKKKKKRGRRETDHLQSVKYIFRDDRGLWAGKERKPRKGRERRADTIADQRAEGEKKKIAHSQVQSSRISEPRTKD